MSVVDSLIAALAGPLGVALTVALAVLLLLREAVPGAGGRAARRWRFGLALASAVLVLPFAAFVAARLTLVSAPLLASDLPAATTANLAPVAEPVAVATPRAATPIAAPPAIPAATPPVATAATPAPAVATPGPQVQIANAVGGLRTGLFEVVIDYSQTARSTTLVYFDLGGGQEPQRLQSATTYRDTTGSRVTERIVVGGRSWTRQPGATWSLSTTAQDVRQEIWPFLPLPGAALSSARADGRAALRWYDPARDADLRLEFDPATGLPSRLEQTTRGTGTVITVIYRGWNTPVAIAPPVEP